MYEEKNTHKGKLFSKIEKAVVLYLRGKSVTRHLTDQHCQLFNNWGCSPNVQQKTPIQIQWKKTVPIWIKLNTDGTLTPSYTRVEGII